MSADNQLSLRDYLAIAQRRALAIVLTFAVVLAASVVVAFLLPRVYQSSGTLLVEGPPLSSEVVRPAGPGNSEQQIQALRQRIMTRESLLSIAAKHHLFEPGAGALANDTNVVNAMRSSIDVNVQIGNMPSWERPTNNFAFTVSFQNGDPKKSLEVTNALIQLFLESSTRERVAQASQANKFLSQEADRVKSQLVDLERRIAAYKRTQGSATGEDQAVSMASIQTLESDLRSTERDQRLALNEVQTLTVDLAGARAGVTLPGSVTTSGPSAVEQDLEGARGELARLRGVFTEDHPDVRAQRRKIESLERALRAEATGSSPARDAIAAQKRLAVSRLEAQINTARARADLLADQQKSLRSAIGQQRSQVSRAPMVERDLAALQRDHDAARAKYEDLRAKQMSAQVVQNLEGEQQGERFSLIEPPLLPEYPFKPDRKKIVALGFFLALAAAAGVVVLLEMIFERVRGMSALTALIGQPPMVAIPYMTTAAELHSTQLLRKWIFGSMAGLVLISLLVVHTVFVPLDTLLISLFSRLG